MGSKGGLFSWPDPLLSLRLSNRYRSGEGVFVFFLVLPSFLWGLHRQLKVLGIQLVFVAAVPSFL